MLQFRELQRDELFDKNTAIIVGYVTIALSGLPPVEGK